MLIVEGLTKENIIVKLKDLEGIRPAKLVRVIGDLVYCPINSCTYTSLYGILSHGCNQGGYTEEKRRFE
jgi:hypothetical protein